MIGTKSKSCIWLKSKGKAGKSQGSKVISCDFLTCFNIEEGGIHKVGIHRWGKGVKRRYTPHIKIFYFPYSQARRDRYVFEVGKITYVLNGCPLRIIKMRWFIAF